MPRTRIHRTCIVSAMLLGVPCFAVAQEAPVPATSTGGSHPVNWT